MIRRKVGRLTRGVIDVTPAGTAAATAVAAVLKTGGTILVISLDAERLVTLERPAKGTNTAVSDGCPERRAHAGDAPPRKMIPHLPVAGIVERGEVAAH